MQRLIGFDAAAVDLTVVMRHCEGKGFVSQGLSIANNGSPMIACCTYLKTRAADQLTTITALNGARSHLSYSAESG